MVPPLYFMVYLPVDAGGDVYSLCHQLRFGSWTKGEELRLQEAIWEQCEGKYQVAIDILFDKPAATKNTFGKWRPELQQLPSQAGLPLLKWGSRRLRLLNWGVIADKVRSRHGQRCRMHFYDV
jgi:hypothetical protein